MERKSIAALVGLIAAVGAVGYWRLRHVHPYEPVLERIELPLPRGAEALDGTRIAFVTDTHAGPFTSASDIARGVALFENEHFDLLLLGGDYVSESNIYAETMANTLAPLVARAELGAIAVMGNHDLPLGVDRVRAELERIGVTVLRYEWHIVDWNGSRLAIAGIDDTVVGDANP